ncbi:AI-2E family transporter [Halorarum halophilum]|uniref:AI-2E family transporter n=1 Tax=Halorarum halophilum TaxID=2743090 RepID=A0A7D5KD51_9EURY|nr:AI-2E family transporter [Halobaculum halophilum]QLG27157.1 AI-2E family transporter [Halobaculum halophilum]
MTEQGDRRRRLSDNAGLSILAAVSSVLAALLVLTQLQYVLLAIVLAYVLAPAQRRLERRMRSDTAALTLISLSVFLLFIPVAYVLAVAIQQGLGLLTAIQEGNLSPDTIQEQFETIGYVIDFELLYATYQEPIATGLQRLATGAVTVIGGLPGVLIGLTVTVFVLFALLRDGDQFVTWLRSVVPVSDRVQRELLGELDTLMWASVIGNVAVAGVQAVLLGIGLALVGMPGVVFLTVATFILTLLPLVGAFGVWLPVSGYLLAIGRPLAAALLVVYGSVVSASDLYLRPAIINRSGALNVATIVVGIFGGIVLFGAIGLFVGPVVLGGTKVALDQFAREQMNSTTD